MEEVTFGQYSLPVLLTVLMGVIFKFVIGFFGKTITKIQERI